VASQIRALSSWAKKRVPLNPLCNSSDTVTTRRVIGLVLLLCPLLAACATDVANRYYGTARYAPRDTTEVELLWQRPTKDFVVIADFQSRGESPEAIRRKAADIGADAVIVSILGGYYSRGEQWAANDKHADTYSRITGTAIKYK
jgi:hypothetical protein